MVLRLALIALVLLTSLSLGLARGQMRAGTEIVLCGGSAIITDPDDPGKARYCPDMAAGLLLTLDPPPVTIGLHQRPGRRAELPEVPNVAPVSQPLPQARGPPPPRAA